MTRAAIAACLFACSLPREAMADDENTYAAPSVAPPARSEPRIAAFGTFGIDYRRIYAIAMTGEDVGIGAGAEMGATSLYVTADVLFAKSHYGLPANQLTLGVSGAFREGRFSFGTGLRVSYMRFTRATDATILGAIGVGVAPFLRVDLVQFDEHALFVSGAVNVDFYGGDPAGVVWGPTLAVGLRF